jgi:hypothetical protein
MWCCALGLYFIGIAWDRLTQFPITLRQGKADVAIAALLVCGVFMIRRAGSWYRFDQGMVQELTASGKVLWQEELMTLESVTWHLGTPTDYLTLKWPKVKRDVQLYPSIEAAFRTPELEAKPFEQESELTSEEPIGPAWRCSGCGEENPGNFGSCWNCQAERANSK